MQITSNSGALFDRIESPQYSSPQRRLGSNRPFRIATASAYWMPAFAGMTCFWWRFELIGLRLELCAGTGGAARRCAGRRVPASNCGLPTLRNHWNRGIPRPRRCPAPSGRLAEHAQAPRARGGAESDAGRGTALAALAPGLAAASSRLFARVTARPSQVPGHSRTRRSGSRGHSPLPEVTHCNRNSLHLERRRVHRKVNEFAMSACNWL